VAAATCPHGFDTRACLICQTLASGSAGAPTSSGTSTKTKRRKAPSSSPVTADARPRASRTDVLDSRGPVARSGGSRLLGGAILVVAILLVTWWVGALVWAALRLLELVGAALVAGVVGWKLGVWHGRRHPR
jgi:Flp pilus assembly protein TadB